MTPPNTDPEITRLFGPIEFPAVSSLRQAPVRVEIRRGFLTEGPARETTRRVFFPLVKRCPMAITSGNRSPRLFFSADRIQKWIWVPASPAGCGPSNTSCLISPAGISGVKIRRGADKDLTPGQMGNHLHTISKCCFSASMMALGFAANGACPLP